MHFSPHCGKSSFRLLSFDLVIVFLFRKHPSKLVYTDRFSHIREGWNWKLHRYMCFCCRIWSSRCSCSRWNGWRLSLHEARIHASKFLYLFWFLNSKFLNFTRNFFRNKCLLTLLSDLSVIFCGFGSIRYCNIGFKANYKSRIWQISPWFTKRGKYVSYFFPKDSSQISDLKF